MNDRKPERIVDEPSSSGKSETGRLTTADMAAAASAPAKAKAAIEARSRSEGESISAEQEFEPLFDTGEAEGLRSRWQVVQAGFVDEPRRSVEEADEFVATVMKRLAEVFAAERENLEKDWDGGEDVSTEDLRVALRRYRSFFDRLLSV